MTTDNGRVRLGPVEKLIATVFVGTLTTGIISIIGLAIATHSSVGVMEHKVGTVLSMLADHATRISELEQQAAELRGRTAR